MVTVPATKGVKLKIVYSLMFYAVISVFRHHYKNLTRLNEVIKVKGGRNFNMLIVCVFFRVVYVFVDELRVYVTHLVNIYRLRKFENFRKCLY
jgi:hypothetical protein